MDIFDKLPLDVCLCILQSFSNLQQAAKLSWASPALFRCFQEFKISLCRHYLVRQYSNDVIQDAVAIITFPRPPNPLNKQEHEAKIVAHLEKWGRKILPDPTSPTTFDANQILELESLFKWIWIYIDDYLVKATSEYLPWAYHRIPEWSPAQAGLLSKAPQNTPYIDRNTLTATQQDRILQAFLRYELLCRVYGPVGTDLDFMESHSDYWNELLPGEDPERFYPDEAPVNDPLRYWNWDLLDGHENGGPVPKNIELLLCVREYVLILHQVLILKHFDAPSPCGPSWRKHDEMQCFSQEQFMPFYGSCPSWDKLFISKDEMPSLLAASGFDMLTGALTVGLQEKDLFDLQTDMGKFPSRLTRGVSELLVTGYWDCDWLPAKFVRIYRQRAGPLFDECRPGPQLPTSIAYAQAMEHGPYGCPGGWMIDEYGIRNELIGHGSGIWASGALKNLRKPFWKVELPRLSREKRSSSEA